jgi:hypothetical protein
MIPLLYSLVLKVTLPRFLENDNLQKLETLEDFKVLIQRVREIPKQIDQVSVSPTFYEQLFLFFICTLR